MSDLARKNGKCPPQRALLARAKVNLSLSIAGKRRDGYHELAGLVAFADYGDELSFALFGEREQLRDAGVRFELNGPFASALATASSSVDDNLVLKAVHLYEQRTGFRLSGRLRLTKNLPIASGIGGGSSDAAAILNLLQSLAPVPLDEQALHELALGLGADVPMCLRSVAQWVSGLGEQCQPVPDFPALSCVLVNPLVKVPTGEIFKRLNAPLLASGYQVQVPDLSFFSTSETQLDWLAIQKNDLQVPAIATAPIIKEALKAIAHDEDCVLARMSGSGATCFGIYRKASDAQQAVDRIRADHPDWWVVAAKLQ